MSSGLVLYFLDFYKIGLDAVLENEELYVGGVKHCRYNLWAHLILDPCKDQHLLCNIPSETCRIL